MNYTVVINMAVWGGALAYYYIDARKWFTGPKITLATDDLTEEQQVAIREEGLEVKLVEGQEGGGKDLEDTGAVKATGSDSGSGEEGVRSG